MPQVLANTFFFVGCSMKIYQKPKLFEWNIIKISAQRKVYLRTPSLGCFLWDYGGLVGNDILFHTKYFTPKQKSRWAIFLTISLEF